MSNYLLLLETGDELLLETGDSIALDGISYTEVNKTLTYKVISSVDKTKSLKYCTRASPSLTKSLTYAISSSAFAQIEKSLKYTVRSTKTPLTKSLRYTVVFNTSTLTKSLTYKLENYLLQENGDFLLQENSDYLIIENPTTFNSLTKSLKYCNIVYGSPRVCYGDNPEYGSHPCYGPINNHSKTLKYTVLTTPTALTKSLTYSIRFATENITKQLVYKVRAKHLLTKTLTYKIEDYLLLEDGDFILQENGDKIIIEYPTTQTKYQKQLKYTLLTRPLTSLKLTYEIYYHGWSPEPSINSDWEKEPQINSSWTKK